MSGKNEPYSELVEIVKCNGDFRRHYGKIIGAYLYLQTVSASRGRSLFWNGLLFVTVSGAAAWLDKYAWLTRLLP